MLINDSGYTDIPHGKLVNIATSLEIFTNPPSKRADLLLQRVINPEIDDYLSRFRAIGEEWLWFSRLILPREKLETILNAKTTHVFYLENKGLLELDFRVAGECEIAYFGLKNEATGQGLGKCLMQFALNTAFNEGVKRVWVHTCTLDDPRALNFYRACGFIPYKRQIEMADDPRFLGLIDKAKGDKICPYLPLPFG
jgi:GNAT superfamily N-acetyltransferase